MKTNKPFNLSSRIQSFTYAITGIKSFFKTEHNAWIHALSSILVIITGIKLCINSTEWCSIIFAIGILFVTEILNTSIETLTDIISPNYNERAKIVKDLAAGAVLVASIIAVIIGLIVFIPYIT